MKLFAVLFMVACVLMLLVRKNKQSKPSRPERRSINTAVRAAGGKVEVNKFHAVSVNVRSDCCGAAKGLKTKRFLRDEVPQLPLADCDQLSCRCRYLHHEDRRVDDDDRRAPVSLQSDLYGITGGDDRREEKAGGRRDSDLVEA